MDGDTQIRHYSWNDALSSKRVKKKAKHDINTSIAYCIVYIENTCKSGQKVIESHKAYTFYDSETMDLFGSRTQNIIRLYYIAKN